jgi:hypothetical protein
MEVDHLPHHSTVKGSSPVTAAGEIVTSISIVRNLFHP